LGRVMLQGNFPKGNSADFMADFHVSGCVKSQVT